MRPLHFTAGRLFSATYVYPKSAAFGALKIGLPGRPGCAARASRQNHIQSRRYRGGVIMWYNIFVYLYYVIQLYFLIIQQFNLIIRFKLARAFRHIAREKSL